MILSWRNLPTGLCVMLSVVISNIILAMFKVSWLFLRRVDLNIAGISILFAIQV